MLKKSTVSGSSIAAGVVAVLGSVLFTTLLYSGKISQTTYGLLLGLLTTVAIILHGFSRVREIDFKNLKMVLDPIAEIKPGSYKISEIKPGSYKISEIKPGSYKDKDTGNMIAISVSPYYSIVEVNDRKYYFIRETGEFDGYSD